MESITKYLILCRLPVSFFVTCSAATGYIVASPNVSADLIPAALGVLLLACGASALNQYQERDIDALMERTRHRPLPAGHMEPRNALIAAVTAMLAGLALLGHSGPMPTTLGALAVVWYNGMYTPLKRRTAFAAVCGAPVGMIAPAIGWTAGGGSISDPRLAVLALLFFLWQVPHFWLLLLRAGDDHERAGLPNLLTVIPRELLSRICILWTAAAGAGSLLLPLFGMVRSPLLYGMLVLSALLSSIGAGGIVRRPSLPRSAFPMINAFLAALMVLISVDALLMR